MTTLPPPPARQRARRALHWFSFGCFTVFGLVLATCPAWSGADPSPTATVGWVLLGLAVLTVPLMIWVRVLRRPDPARSVSTGADALELRLRSDLPAATAVLGVVWAALAAWAVVAGGVTGGGLLAVPLVLLFAALVPDSLRAAARHPHLRVDADGVRLHGWSLDGGLAWDDTVSVDVLSVRPQRPVIRLLSTAGAASLQRTWHRYLVRLDLRTDEPALDLPLLAFAAPDRVAAFLTILRGLPREERVAQVTGPGPAFLRGDVTLDG